MTSLNGNGIRQRRLDLGISQHQLADAIPTSTVLLQRIENDDPASATMLTTRQLFRLAETLSTPVSSLLTETNTLHADPSSDAAVLTSLLVATSATPNATAVARALSWRLDQVLAARTNANAALAPLGIAITERSNGWTIAPTDPQAQQASATLTAQAAETDSMSTQYAKILFAVTQGVLTGEQGRLSPDTRIGLGYLQRVGLIHLSRATITISERLSYAFPNHG